jgi:hypothetical protein
MTPHTALSPSIEDHAKAFTEVAFLLDIFAATIDNIMGGATASVGRIAGRSMARKLPINIDRPTLHQSLDVVIGTMKSGFEISYTDNQQTPELTFARCVVRDVCRERHLEPGCPLCKLFHSYFDGIVNEIVCRPVKSELRSASDACTLCLKTQ